MELFKRLINRGVLEPKQMARKIGKMMDSSKTESIFRIYVPSRFRIVLSEEDLLRLEPYRDSVEKELIDYINDHADKQGYYLLSEPMISLEADKGLSPGYFQILALFDEDDDTKDQSNTMIFVKTDDLILDTKSTTKVFKEKIVEYPDLEVLEGNDLGMVYDIRETDITIGRKEDNQVVLMDPNVSRYHARIFLSKDWQIEDLQSTNGVFLNGKQIKKSTLRSGDEISLGSTLMKFRIR